MIDTAESRFGRAASELAALRLQSRVELDDGLHPSDPILAARASSHGPPPGLYVHRDPVPHAVVLAVALTSYAVVGCIAWGVTELVDRPLDLTPGQRRRSLCPALGVTSAAFAASAACSAVFGRRPGRSSAARVAVTVTSTCVLGADLVAVALGFMAG